MLFVIVGNTPVEGETNISKVLHKGTFEECEKFISANIHLLQEFPEVAMVEVEEFASTATMIQ